MNIVVDTNVLISGLITPYGCPGEIIRIVAAGLIPVAYDSRILEEYREVLSRPKFNFHPDITSNLIIQIRSEGILVTGVPLAQPLKDPNDEMFLEVAIAARSRYLVTGNLKHFPSKKSLALQILSPSDFISELRQKL